MWLKLKEDFKKGHEESDIIKTTKKVLDKEIKKLK